MRCRQCRRRVLPWWAWFSYRRTCDRCRYMALVLRDEPSEDIGPEETEPADIDDCSTCHGLGECYVRTDWETGAPEFETCPHCQGTGSAYYPYVRIRSEEIA